MGAFFCCLFWRVFAAQYHVALRQASVMYVFVHSFGFSPRSSSCLQLHAKSTAYPCICCAIPCRVAASLGHVRLCTLPRLFLALLVLLATSRQKHRVPAHLLCNTISRCGKPRSCTVFVHSLGFSSRSSSCLQLHAKSTANPCICFAIPIWVPSYKILAQGRFPSASALHLRIPALMVKE